MAYLRGGDRNLDEVAGGADGAAEMFLGVVQERLWVYAEGCV